MSITLRGPVSKLARCWWCNAKAITFFNAPVPLFSAWYQLAIVALTWSCRSAVNVDVEAKRKSYQHWAETDKQTRIKISATCGCLPAIFFKSNQVFTCHWTMHFGLETEHKTTKNAGDTETERWDSQWIVWLWLSESLARHCKGDRASDHWSEKYFFTLWLFSELLNLKAVGSIRIEPIRNQLFAQKAGKGGSAFKLSTFIISSTRFPLLSAPVMSNVKKTTAKAAFNPVAFPSVECCNAYDTNLNSWTLATRSLNNGITYKGSFWLFFFHLWEGKTCLTGNHKD